MRCSKARKLFSPSVDGALTAAELAGLDAHIQGCRTCRERLEQIRALHVRLSSLEPLHAPNGFTTRVMANISDDGAQRAWSFFPVVERFVEAAVLALVIIIGTRAGSFLGTAFTRQNTTIASTLSLDTLEADQPASIGGAYMAMMEGINEK